MDTFPWIFPRFSPIAMVFPSFFGRFPLKSFRWNQARAGSPIAATLSSEISSASAAEVGRKMVMWKHGFEKSGSKFRVQNPQSHVISCHFHHSDSNTQTLEWTQFKLVCKQPKLTCPPSKMTIIEGQFTTGLWPSRTLFCEGSIFFFIPSFDDHFGVTSLVHLHISQQVDETVHSSGPFVFLCRRCLDVDMASLASGHPSWQGGGWRSSITSSWRAQNQHINFASKLHRILKFTPQFPMSVSGPQTRVFPALFCCRFGWSWLKPRSLLGTFPPPAGVGHADLKQHNISSVYKVLFRLWNLK